LLRGLLRLLLMPLRTLSRMRNNPVSLMAKLSSEPVPEIRTTG
jgi:hypothetical protein